MSLPGMKSTADFAADERPKDWRSAIMLLSPRNNTPLFGLTAAMKSESTSDPEFKWWEEQVQMFTPQVSANVAAGDTTLNLVSGGTKFKPGDMLKSQQTGEAVRVVAIISDTQVTVQRGTGVVGTPAGTPAAINVANQDPRFVFIGSAYREGAPRSVGSSYNPVQKSNVTQIFRDPLEMTRTAQQTSYRTGNAWANDRRRTLHKHSLGIERAFWLGSRYETMESGQPLRFTDGVLSFIPASNVKTVTNSGVIDMDELESYLSTMFAYGSSEKLAFMGINTLVILNALVRKNTRFQFGQREKEYGMSVMRFYTPAGTLVLTEHPLFGQEGGFLANDLVILDTDNLRYRYMQDTTYRKNIQDQGVDGQADEYLTEAGLEVHHGGTHFWLKGLKGAQADD